MAKVTFEFDDVEENDEIQLIVNRHKLISALYDLSDYRRELYKGWNENEKVVVKDNEVVWKDGEKLKEYDIENAELYIREDMVIDKIDSILDSVNFLMM